MKRELEDWFLFTFFAGPFIVIGGSFIYAIFYMIAKLIY